MKERNDDFQNRRKKLATMSDKELKQYFFKLAGQVVDPLVALGHKNTSKSIERSVLLRMGFSSIEADGVVDILGEYDLLKKGAGHCVYKVAKENGKDIHQAGTQIAEGHHISFLKGAFKSNE